MPVQHAGDNPQMVYVWLFAPSAHLTSVGYPRAAASPAGEGDKGEDRKEMTVSGWPFELHVLGKDILKCVKLYVHLSFFSFPSGILLILLTLSHNSYTQPVLTLLSLSIHVPVPKLSN